MASHLEMAGGYLQGIAQRLRDQEVNASSRAVVGASVAEALIELARQERVGLVAIATHGRGGVRRFVLGSVADKLLRGSEVPILVHRPRTGRKHS